jgi:hypothetical protein
MMNNNHDYDSFFDVIWEKFTFVGVSYTMIDDSTLCTQYDTISFTSIYNAISYNLI